VSLESTYDDSALTRYLLGQFAGEEADRLDELAIVDDEMAWRVRTVENDLVDAYVRGTLDAESRQHFETHYLASPKRRAKVRFAARFARAVDVLGPPARLSPEPLRRPDKRGWLEWLVPRSAGGWRVAYGAAALLLTVTVMCGLLVMRDLRMGRSLNESEQQRAALDRRTRELENQLAGQRAAAAQAQEALEQTQAREPSKAPAVALVLWPQTRGAGGSGLAASAGAAATPAIAVPPGVDHVTLELQLETPDFVRYSAVLKESATNRIVWRGDRLTAPASGAPPMLSVAVPANLLTRRSYVLELIGYSAAGGGDGDVIGAYAFQVARR
jgi:hypothetical protein